MFKLAYGAGHDLLEPGKNFEWHLNERVARYFAEEIDKYEGVVALRTDDPTGNKEVRLGERCRRANDFKADFVLSIHHNAGINGGSGGGIMGFTHPNSSAKSREYRDAIYDSCVKVTGLRGDRANPKTTSNLYVLRNTDAPAVLMEYGFMDSTTDRKVIDTEDYARKIARATMEAIAKVAGLKEKAEPVKPVPKPQSDYSLDDFIRDVQNVTGCVVDGKAGAMTLNSAPTISVNVNQKCKAVLPVQRRLKALGFYDGILDGVAEAKFDSAVYEFQKSIGIKNPDRELTNGGKSWRKLLGME